jgi:hypothetical protein
VGELRRPGTSGPRPVGSASAPRVAERSNTTPPPLDQRPDRPCAAADRLKELEAEGLVTRTIVPTHPAYSRDTLSEKGRALMVAMQPLVSRGLRGAASGRRSGRAGPGMMAPMSASSSTTPVVFRERLLPGPVGWLGALAAGFVAGVVLWPIGHALGIGVGIAVAVGAGVALAATSPLVEVSGGELRAGRAHVPVALLRDPTPITTADDMRVELGPRLDARAYVCLRAWARTGVRATLDDPSDPTPYWLVSTRRPTELAAAIRSGAARA